MGRNIKSFARLSNKLYFIQEYESSDQYTHNAIKYIEQGITAITSSHKLINYASGSVWYVETGEWDMYIPEYKTIEKLIIKLVSDAPVKVEIKYDGNSYWTALKTIIATKKKTETFEITPERCDYYRLRFSGNGNTKIFSITRTIEIGSELNAK
jgi:hypothetical protein